MKGLVLLSHQTQQEQEVLLALSYQTVQHHPHQNKDVLPHTSNSGPLVPEHFNPFRISHQPPEPDQA